MANHSAGGLVGRLGDGEDGGGSSVGILVDEFEDDMAGDGIAFDINEDAPEHRRLIGILTLWGGWLPPALLADYGIGFRGARWLVRGRPGGMGVEFWLGRFFGVDGDGVGW